MTEEKALLALVAPETHGFVPAVSERILYPSALRSS